MPHGRVDDRAGAGPSVQGAAVGELVWPDQPSACSTAHRLGHRPDAGGRARQRCRRSSSIRRASTPSPGCPIRDDPKPDRVGRWVTGLTRLDRGGPGGGAVGRPQAASRRSELARTRIRRCTSVTHRGKGRWNTGLVRNTVILETNQEAIHIMSGYNAVLARNTENAPNGIGPYSQTVAFSHYNNLSAQLPIDPKTGKLVAGGIKEQAEQCFKNIKAIVDSIDHVMSDVVRITVFVKNIKDIDAVDEVYKILPNLCSYTDDSCSCSFTYGCFGAN